MLAFIPGLGMQEVLVLALLLGGGLFAVFIVIFLVRRGGGGRVSELEAENRRLRRELDGKSRND